MKTAHFERLRNRMIGHKAARRSTCGGPRQRRLPMPIDVTCGQCGWKAVVKAELAGKKGKCPTCGEPIVVPRPTEQPQDVEDAAAAALLEGDDGPAPPPQSYMPPAYSTESSAKPLPASK